MILDIIVSSWLEDEDTFYAVEKRFLSIYFLIYDELRKGFFLPRVSRVFCSHQDQDDCATCIL